MLINLAASNFITATFGLPPDIMAAIQMGWKFGYGPCIALGFYATLSIMVTLYTLLMISMIRCIMVWHPITFKLYECVIVKCLILSVWIIAFGFAILPILGFGYYVPDSSGLA